MSDRLNSQYEAAKQVEDNILEKQIKEANKRYQTELRLKHQKKIESKKTLLEFKLEHVKK
jgi:hypothetical protein